MTPRSGPAGEHRTGYYVSGHDWPAIETPIPTEAILSALEDITDDDVRAALDSLKTAGEGTP